jgi:hypothetical protein
VLLFFPLYVHFAAFCEVKKSKVKVPSLDRARARAQDFDLRRWTRASSAGLEALWPRVQRQTAKRRLLGQVWIIASYFVDEPLAHGFVRAYVFNSNCVGGYEIRESLPREHSFVATNECRHFLGAFLLNARVDESVAHVRRGDRLRPPPLLERSNIHRRTEGLSRNGGTGVVGVHALVEDFARRRKPES